MTYPPPTPAPLVACHGQVQFHCPPDAALPLLESSERGTVILRVEHGPVKMVVGGYAEDLADWLVRTAEAVREAAQLARARKVAA